jgi:rhamnulokinase
LAFDLGAESGRAVVGTLDGGRLEVLEVLRFPNAPIRVLGRLRWDVTGLFEEVRRGLKIAASFAPDLGSAAVDTWGVDFGLLGEDGFLLDLPLAYRDERNPPAMEEFLSRYGRERIYALTGVQFLPFNSLFQLFALVRDGSAPLDAARRLLFMPGLFTYLLSGAMATDATIASTSQLVDPRSGDWSEELLRALGLPSSLFGTAIAPGTVVGRIRREIASEAGLADIPIVATAGHDTAAAVAAIPAEGSNWAYISSGTWSLIGIESPVPLISDESRRLNFTNEAGLGGRIRFLKNVTGLWLVAQCRKQWAADRPVGYEELAAAAQAAPAFRSFVDPDAPDFLNPPDMPAAIRDFCRSTNQPVPESRGEVIRCALESLALKYRLVLDELGRLAPRPIERLHVIGGGSRNGLLCRFTAEASGLPVIAGPVEATAIGNVMGQALALGRVGSLEEIREIVRRSEGQIVYGPDGARGWDAAIKRFRAMIEERKGER